MGFFDGFFNKEKEKDLQEGLLKTKQGFFEKITKALVGKKQIDELERIFHPGRRTSA